MQTVFGMANNCSCSTVHVNCAWLGQTLHLEIIPQNKLRCRREGAYSTAAKTKQTLQTALSPQSVRPKAVTCKDRAQKGDDAMHLPKYGKGHRLHRKKNAA